MLMAIIFLIITIALCIVMAIASKPMYISEPEPDKQENNVSFSKLHWEKHITSQEIIDFCKIYDFSVRLFFEELKKQDYFFTDKQDFEKLSFYHFKVWTVGYIGTKEKHEYYHYKIQQQKEKEFQEELNNIKKYL